MFNAKNLLVGVGSSKVPVAAFGKGEKNLIILPGVGDGLTTVEGKALPLAFAYKNFADKYCVFVMSRRIPLPEKFGTKEMAADIAGVMDELGIEKASIAGVSMGGMIAQHFAADFPEKTEKLVLVATSPEKTSEMEVLSEWIGMAEKGEGVALMKSSVKNMYTEGYYKKNGWLCGITGRFTMPKSYDRFIKLSRACFEHNAIDVLEKIKAPTLIIGGEEDRTVGPEGSVILANKISGAKLIMYPGLGHAVYDEASDFWEKVLEFLE